MRGETAALISAPPVLFFHLDEEARRRGAVFEAPRAGDAGFDIRACEDVLLEPGEQRAVATGLRVGIPDGWVGIVKDRSSVASQRVYTHAGVIDAGYRGEVKIVLSNHGSTVFKAAAGAKIAQMVVLPCVTACCQVDTLDALGATERGEGGFGSTGV